MNKTTQLLLISFLALSLSSCQTAYFSALEKVGFHKRDILVKRVDSARSAQGEAKEQFSSALEQFTTVLNVEETELSEAYEKLQGSFDNSESQAKKVSKRINQVESVALALFDEWEDELDVYKSARLRENSQSKLDSTKVRYEKLITAMRQAEGKMEPVLGAFRDQVLYLKHNLNAQAVSSLQDELVKIEENVVILIREMEQSMAEADSFMKSVDASA